MTARYFLTEIAIGEVEDFDRVFAGLIGLVASLLWPVLLAGALLGRFTANEMKEKP